MTKWRRILLSKGLVVNTQISKCLVQEFKQVHPQWPSQPVDVEVKTENSRNINPFNTLGEFAEATENQ